ncbi:MAG: glutathione S-transferase N-terminal domain-containing protein [Thiohalomonadaceae bacterium]
MKLFHSPFSPFVRKVVVFAIETGLEGRIERQTVNPWESHPELIAANPLGKVPTLITDEGLAIYDSAVICEYLDGLHNGPDLIPHAGVERSHALRLEALADGIAEATVLRRMESVRPAALQSSDWMDLQARTVERGLDALECEVEGWGQCFGIGQITVACALGYLDFRFSTDDWRGTRPTLAAWYARIAQRPAMIATEPKG